MDDDECSCSNGVPSHPASQVTPLPESPRFRVGRNSHGDWVVQDESGRYGGIFIDRSEAVKYALFENGCRQHAVMMVPGTMELDMSMAAAGRSAGVRN